MKFYICLLSFIILTITTISSCDKDEDTNLLIGTWKASGQVIIMDTELISSYGEDELNDFTLQFNADNTVTWTENDNPKPGTYTRTNSGIIITMNDSGSIFEFTYYFENESLILEFYYSEASGETTVVKTTFKKI